MTEPAAISSIADEIRPRLTDAAERAVVDAESIEGAIPLAEELAVALLYYGTDEPAFNGALAKAGANYEEVASRLTNLVFDNGSLWYADPTLADRHVAFWRGVGRCTPGRPIDAARLAERLLASDYLSPEAQQVLADAGLSRELFAARELELPPDTRLGATPPLGHLLDPRGSHASLGHPELVGLVADRLSRGRHTWLFGPAGAGKAVLARAAAVASGRPAVLLRADDVASVPIEERAELLERLYLWCQIADAGLVITDLGRGDPFTLVPPSKVPTLVAASRRPIAPWPLRRFRHLEVDEPSSDAVRAALASWLSIAGRPEVSPAVLELTVDLADRFLGGPLALPGSAIRIMERAVVELRARGESSPLHLDAAAIESATVTLTGLPLAVVSSTERNRLLGLEQRLGSAIIGQREAISAVAGAVRRRAVNLQAVRQPKGAFLFVGPTGVGKTELSLQLARELYGSEDALVRFDMGEYQKSHEIAKLLGAPPGYLGHDKGDGLLVKALSAREEGVLLLDEIEKADAAVYDLLLGALDYGMVTGATGKTASLRRWIVIMTSNLGGRLDEAIVRRSSIGFGGQIPDPEEKRRELRERAVRDHFRPEFLNRLDAVIHFHPLSSDDLGQVLALIVERYAAAHAAVGVEVRVGDKLREQLTAEALGSGMGGRALKRTFTTEVEDRMANALIEGLFRRGARYTFDHDAAGNPDLFITVPQRRKRHQAAR